MRVLDEQPGAELSLRRVAREAGITPPAIYAHFADRDAMTAAVIRASWDQLADDLATAARTARAKGPLAQLRAQLRAYVRYAMGRPSRYQLLFALPPATDIPAALRSRPVEPAYLEVVATIRECRRAGYTVGTRDAEAAALLVLCVAHGRVALAHTAPDLGWNKPDQVLAFVTTAIENMMIPAPAAPAPAAPAPAAPAPATERAGCAAGAVAAAGAGASAPPSSSSPGG
jgi:AcrR family transcriptional regulator